MTLSAICGHVSQGRFWPWLAAPGSTLTGPPLVAVPSIIVSSSSEALVVFREFLHQLLRKYFDGDVIALAKAADVRERSMRKTLSGDSEYPLSLEHCLSLADTLRAHVSVTIILQKANRIDSLKQMQRLFGRPKLNAYEEALLKIAHRLDAAGRDQLLTYARFLNQQDDTSPLTKPKARKS